jgi:[acyl-carrier-protein] S-malonyltransferase
MFLDGARMRAGLFPGQGIDAARVTEALPADHLLLDQAQSILGYDLLKRVSGTARRTRRPLLTTEMAQPAIFTAGIISFEAAVRDGVTFDYLAGHSLGEYTALVAGGSISFTEGLRLVAARGKAMQRAALASPGGMIAVQGLTLDAAEDIASHVGLTVANDNSPSQVVLSGREDALSRAAEIVKSRGGRTILLPLNGAFHSPAMEPAIDELEHALVVTEVRCPTTPVLSNVSAAPYRAPGEIRKLLGHQLTERVRFRECVTWLDERGVTDFMDLGPGAVVGKLARATAAKAKEVVDA